MAEARPGPERSAKVAEKAQLRYVLESEKRKLGRPVPRRRDVVAEMDPRGREPTENLFRKVKADGLLQKPREAGVGQTPTRQAFDSLYEKSIQGGDGHAYVGKDGVRFLWVSKEWYPDLFERLLRSKSARSMSRPGARLMLARSEARVGFGEAARHRKVALCSMASGGVSLFEVVERDDHGQSDKYAVSCMVLQLL